MPKISDLKARFNGMRFKMGYKDGFGGTFPFLMIFPQQMQGGHFKFHAAMGFVLENSGDFSDTSAWPKEGKWSLACPWNQLEFDEIHWTSSNGGKEKWTPDGKMIDGGDGNIDEAKAMWTAYVAPLQVFTPPVSAPISIPAKNNQNKSSNATPTTPPYGGWPETP